MRTIKFRAWDKENNKFFDSIKTKGDQCFFGINSKGLVFEVYVGKGEWKDMPLQQFTGFLDKNGKEIYEGDIVTNNMGKRIYVGWYDDEGCWWSKTSLEDPELGSGPLSSLHHNGLGVSKEPEVIGNIYENPELLC